MNDENKLIDMKRLKFLLTCLKDIFASKSELDKVKTLLDELPKYNKPSISLSVNPKLLKHNTLTSVMLNVNFNKNDAGDIIEIVWFKDGMEFYRGTELEINDEILLLHNESVVYEVILVYSEGIVKDSLLGIPDDVNNIKAGELSSKVTIKSFADSYVGIYDEENGTINRLITTNIQSKVFDVEVSLERQRLVYMYPTSFGELKSIKDANGFDYINSYDCEIRIEDDVEYYVYILKDPVTITGFVQIYN